MTVELIQGLLLAFAIMVILMPPYIRMLRATGFTKQIRIEGPEAHLVKHGTPTMGGGLIIVVVLGSTCCCAGHRRAASTPRWRPSPGWRRSARSTTT